LEQLAQIALTYVLSIQNTDLIYVTLRLWRQKAILRLLLWKPLACIGGNVSPWCNLWSGCELEDVTCST
jgi:hypothetical protein